MGAQAPSSFVNGIGKGNSTVLPESAAAADTGGDAHPPLTGKLLGPYRVIARLAVGGMAELWLASRTVSDGDTQKVVLKTMLPSVSESREYVRMFEREAAIGLRMRHPNLVRILDHGRAADRHFIAMEYIDGLNLREIGLRFRELEEAFPPRLLLTVLIDVCRGLHAAHEISDKDGPLQFVHRDLSPENIMVTRTGATKLIDFGAALTLRVPTSSTRFVGKFRYVAPERIEGRDEDRRGDVYSLGVILYEYLTGRRPFEGDDLSMVARILEGRPRSPQSLQPELLPELAQITCKAMAFKPSDRYDTAAALAADLLPLVEGPLLASGKEANRRCLRRVFDMLDCAGSDNDAAVSHEADTKTVEMEVDALKEALRRTREETTVVRRLSPLRRRPNGVAHPAVAPAPVTPMAPTPLPMLAVEAPVREAALENAAREEVRHDGAPAAPAASVLSSLSLPVAAPTAPRPLGVDPASLFDRLERPTPPVGWFDIRKSDEETSSPAPDQRAPEVSGPAFVHRPTHAREVGEGVARRAPVDEAVQRFDHGLSLLADKLYAAALEEWERACALEPENRLYQVNLKRLRDRMQSDHPEAGPNPRSVHEHQE